MTPHRILLVASAVFTCPTVALSLCQSSHSLFVPLSLTSTTVIHYAMHRCDDVTIDRRRPRRVPQRALPHIQIRSRDEEARRAGYIIRRNEFVQWSENGASLRTLPRNHGRTRQSINGRKVNPLRKIRRILLRRSDEPQQYNRLCVEGENEPMMETLDQKHYQEIGSPVAALSMDPPTNAEQRQKHFNDFSSIKNPHAINNDAASLSKSFFKRGSNKVTFQATREASHTISLPPSTAFNTATLTEYMTQPVEMYSLRSFHADENTHTKGGPSNEGTNGTHSPKVRHWHVRRLTIDESQKYMNRLVFPRSKPTIASPSLKESNLFRLVVPLQPLIGLNLTPVLDLEVIPPEIVARTQENDINSPRQYTESHSEDGDISCDNMTKALTKSIPFKLMPRPVGYAFKYSNRNDHILSPVVKVRSLSVSLLSSQEDLSTIISKKKISPNINKRNQNGETPLTKESSHQDYSSRVQEEALEIIRKVDDWLKPQISFQAELTWTDNMDGDTSASKMMPSMVKIKSTATTSLSIPKLPSGILHATIPSVFLVKRLGVTLTARALDSCLPRFLQQLEKDYCRWSETEMSADEKDSNKDLI